MTDIQLWGIDLILWLQRQANPFLDIFFQTVTHLGALGYLLVIPIILYCIEPRLALRTVLAMVISQYLVMLIKDIVQEPRPFMADSRIISDGEYGYSFPSGHALGSIVFYGLLALWTEKKWLRYALFAMIFFIGLSRNYLGVHYPHDVLAGWLIGIGYLWGWLALQRQTSARYYSYSRSNQLIIAVLPAALVAAVHYAVFGDGSPFALAGTVSVTTLLLISDQRKPLLDTRGTLWQKSLRVVIGIALCAITFTALRPLYPEAGEGVFMNSLLWVHGALLMGLMGWAAPRLFVLLKLTAR